MKIKMLNYLLQTQVMILSEQLLIKEKKELIEFGGISWVRKVIL